MSKIKIRNHFDRTSVKTKQSQEICAQQHFKDECDINNIVSRYAQTGDHRLLNAKQPNYGLHDPTTFHEAMNIVTSSKQTFDELPSNIRKKFNHDPAQFLEFATNKENGAELLAMGLIEPVSGAEMPKASSVTDTGTKEKTNIPKGDDS